jgi:lysophospholipase L1-like esterase
MQALTAEWVNSNGADTPLLFGNTLGTGVDAVDGSFGIPANGNGYPPMFSIEWIYPSSITPVTFLHVGDSLIEGYRWPRLAVNRRNTNPLRPLHHVCLGGSTTRTESFVGNMYLYLQTQARPDYVLMEIVSPNNYSPLSDFTNNISNADLEYNRLVEIAQFLAGLGIKMIWWVPVNYSPKVNPTDPNDETTTWNKLYNKSKKYAAANGIEWMDINGDSRLVWVGGSTYNASSNPTSWNGDGTHPSDPVGIEGFTTIYSEKLASLGF